jgi:hypothetical protein
LIEKRMEKCTPSMPEILRKKIFEALLLHKSIANATSLLPSLFGW